MGDGCVDVSPLFLTAAPSISERWSRSFFHGAELSRRFLRGRATFGQFKEELTNQQYPLRFRMRDFKRDGDILRDTRQRVLDNDGRAAPQITDRGVKHDAAHRSDAAKACRTGRLSADQDS